MAPMQINVIQVLHIHYSNIVMIRLMTITILKGTTDIVQATHDFRIPFTLVKFGAKISVKSDYESVGPCWVYAVIRYQRYNPYLQNDKEIIKALASKAEFALELLDTFCF